MHLYAFYTRLIGFRTGNIIFENVENVLSLTLDISLSLEMFFAPGFTSQAAGRLFYLSLDPDVQTSALRAVQMHNSSSSQQALCKHSADTQRVLRCRFQ